jgi:hypothetical protein
MPFLKFISKIVMDSQHEQDFSIRWVRNGTHVELHKEKFLIEIYKEFMPINLKRINFAKCGRYLSCKLRIYGFHKISESSCGSFTTYWHPDFQMNEQTQVSSHP